MNTEKSTIEARRRLVERAVKDGLTERQIAEKVAQAIRRFFENEHNRELVERLRAGDEGAFGELYDAASARVHGLVRRVVRDPAQSEEVTQETFLEIWRQSARFDPRRVKSWLI